MAPPIAPGNDDDDLPPLPFGELPGLAPEPTSELGAPSPAPHEHEFPLDGFEIVPGYGEEEEVLPYPDELSEPHKAAARPAPRVLVVLASALAVVLVGVLALIFFRPGGSSTAAPPIITADATPTKVAPPESQSAGDADSNKLIYDRVENGTAAAASSDTTLVTPGSEPLAPLPSGDNGDNPIARVILPGGPAPEAPADDPTALPDDPHAQPGDVAADASTDSSASGPKKVRTLVVRPDGTIVTADAAPADAAPASTDAVPAASDSAQPGAVAAASTTDDTAAIAGDTGGKELAITPAPEQTPNKAAVAAETEAQQPAAKPGPTVVATAEPAPAPAPPKPAPPKKVVSADNPIDLTPGKPATQVASREPAGTAAATTAGGMMVQVSSQKSEDAARATYRDLQARYKSIIGTYEPNVQRADLGDRGVYYRVRVGPFASADAQRLCDALKGAGGDCVLTAR